MGDVIGLHEFDEDGNHLGDPENIPDAPPPVEDNDDQDPEPAA